MSDTIKILLTVAMLFGICPFQSQSLSLDWKFDTGEKVLASPVVKDNVIYIGSQDGTFYALDLPSGKELWRFTTGGNIQAKALVLKETVFFESANTFYLLEAMTGRELWKYDTEMTPFSFEYKDHIWPYKIDPFDDKRSSAILNEGVIYSGAGNGKLYGFEATTGKVVMELSSEESAPIRSTPFITDDRLYYGDWNGIVYCYSIAEEGYVWKKKTFRGERPYQTFGGVVSEFTIYEDLLFMGARNPMMNVLLTDTGVKEWTYTDPDGGWMVGDPVIFRDTLYIGGSDNLSMYAFEPQTGRKLWQHNSGKNIYTKPFVNDKWLIYTCGNGYNPNDTGKVYIVDRMTGEALTSYECAKGIFSSPVLVGDRIVFGCYDGHIYAVRVVRP